MSLDLPQWASREEATSLQLRRFSNAEETLARQASCATPSASCAVHETPTRTPRSVSIETSERQASQPPICDVDVGQTACATAATVAAHKRARSATGSVASPVTEECAVPTLSQLQHELLALHRDLTALQNRPTRPSTATAPVGAPFMPSPSASAAAQAASRPAGLSDPSMQAGCAELKTLLGCHDATALYTPHDGTQGRQAVLSPHTARMQDLPTMAGARRVSDTPLCPSRLHDELPLHHVIVRPATASPGPRPLHASDYEGSVTGRQGMAQQEALSPSQARLCTGGERSVLSPSSRPKRRVSASPHVAHATATRLGSPGGSHVRDGRIRVVVRKRPALPSELGTDCVRVQGHTVRLVVTRQRVDLSEYTEQSNFVFDDVFDEHASNTVVHREGVCGLLAMALHGGSASCFAYGQTGSGKTYTMMGRDGGEAVFGSAERGLYLLGAADLFAQLSSTQVLSVAFYEIYCNSLFDLLQERGAVVLREDAAHRVHLRGLSWHVVSSLEELCALVRRGLTQRSTGSTSANERSSRSHAVLTMSITDRTRPDFCGVVNYVDLAGSERAADTVNQDRQTRLEGAEINKSLLALKECIRALDEKRRHIPFRGSKLTEVLRDSFVGSSRTVMIANISPTSVNYEHTANTLRYAFRVKGLSIPVVTPSRERNAPRSCTPAVRVRGGDTPRSPRALREWGNVDRVAQGKPQRVSPSAAPRADSRGRRQGETSCVGAGRRWQRTSLAVGEPCQRAVEAAAELGGIEAMRDATQRAATADVAWHEGDELQHLLPGSAVCLRVDEAIGQRRQADTRQAVSGDTVRVTETEAELKQRVLRQLQRDLGTEIQRILDERDALIYTLRRENAALRQRLRRLECERAPSTPPSSPAGKDLLLPPCYLTPGSSFSLT